MLAETGAAQISLLVVVLHGCCGLACSVVIRIGATSHLQVLRHADNQVDDGERHEDYFEVLVAQKGDEEFEETFSFEKDAHRVSLYAVLDGDVDLIYGGRAHFPVIGCILHFEALISCYDAHKLR